VHYGVQNVAFMFIVLYNFAANREQRLYTEMNAEEPAPRPWEYLMIPFILRPRPTGNNLTVGFISILLRWCLALPFSLWGYLPTSVLEDLTVLLWFNQDQYPTHRMTFRWVNDIGQEGDLAEETPRGWFEVY
jgi:hypothetical protein